LGVLKKESTEMPLYFLTLYRWMDMFSGSLSIVLVSRLHWMGAGSASKHFNMKEGESESPTSHNTRIYGSK
jgi:hypothetical protein